MTNHDQAQMIEQQTQLIPDNLTMMGFAFASNLLGTAPCRQGVGQFNAIATNDSQHRRGSQKLVCLLTMGSQQAKKPRPLRQKGKPATPVAAYPPREHRVAAPFEGKEHAEGHDLPGPEAGQGMFRAVLHGLVY